METATRYESPCEYLHHMVLLVLLDPRVHSNNLLYIQSSPILHPVLWYLKMFPSDTLAGSVLSLALD